MCMHCTQLLVMTNVLHAVTLLWLFSALTFEKHFLCLILLTGATWLFKRENAIWLCKRKTDGEHTGQEEKEEACFAKASGGKGSILHVTVKRKSICFICCLSFCRMCWVDSCRSAECAGFSLVVLQNVLGSVLSFCRMCWVQSCRSAECAGFSLVLQNVLGSSGSSCWGTEGSISSTRLNFGWWTHLYTLILIPLSPLLNGLGEGRGWGTQTLAVWHTVMASLPAACPSVDGRLAALCTPHPLTHTPACPSWFALWNWTGKIMPPIKRISKEQWFTTVINSASLFCMPR